ncbi:hypothetical protein [Methylobacterium nigriterrae]|uniref:hypothetical protein n=1 Tax=Methylobacterium nigriterrae TaxID=3127512 RepID=UPI00301347C1
MRTGRCASEEVAPGPPDAAAPGAAPEPWLRTTADVLHEELDYFCGSRKPGDALSLAERADAARLAALCLSGGGIRSTTFCLGALQALAGRGMFTQFHFLSTVSGGGFAGGWLQVFIKECGGVAQAEAELARPGCDALSKLRGYTNYLTPETGPLSKDTWAAVVLYLRNLILIWLVLLPSLLFLPLVLVFYRTLLEIVGTTLWWWSPLALGSAALLVGTFSACIMVPSHRPASGDGTEYVTPGRIFACIILPTSAWALCVPGTLRALVEPPLASAGAELSLLLALMYFAVQMIAYWGAMAWQARGSDPGLTLYRQNSRPWLAASAVSTILIYAGVRFAVAFLTSGDPTGQGPGETPVSQILTVFAPICLVVVHLLQSVVFIGLRRSAPLADLDREWVARADGQILLLAFCWTALCLCCLTLSETLPTLLTTSDRSRWPTWAASLVAVLSGPAAAYLGKQVFSRVQAMAARKPSDDALLLALNIMAVVFAIVLFALLAWCLRWVLSSAQIALGGCDVLKLERSLEAFKASCRSRLLYEWAPLPLQLLIAAVLSTAVYIFGSVNVNRFSMHGIYRNRLSRGFLGSARKSRDGDPFTDFDEADSPPVKDLTTAERRLLPVINMTLNLTNVRRADWAERKAAPFTATPFACGSAALDREDQPRTDGQPPGPRGSYARTSDYAGMETRGDRRNLSRGPLLGGMLTISGAAMSPNWGYHSSPTIAFLMTMFNVRLGAWLPNPAVALRDDLKLATPRNSVVALLSELGGRTTDTRQAVYLSDGGHFDNLGLYEMLRRRCARIVVIDAGQDETCTFFDLGNAIRKAEIDGLAKIEMGEMRILSRSAIEAETRQTEAAGYARGTIHYPGARDAASLIYIKPSYLRDIPVEVRAYGAKNASFPHESTANQWFSESQFESYRALGFFQIDSMFGSQLASVSDWASHLDRQLNRGSAQT